MEMDTWMVLLEAFERQENKDPMGSQEVDGRRRYALQKKGFIRISGDRIVVTETGKQARRID